MRDTPNATAKPFTLFGVAITFLLGATAHADVTLPLQGYCHANRYMPVRVDGEAVELKTSDSIPTVAAAGAARVAPVLIGPAANELIANASHLKLNVLREDEKLIAIGGHVIESDVQPLFGDAHVVTLPIDDAIFSSPPAAWQSLDGVLLDAATKLDDSRRSALLAAGVTLAVTSPARPDVRWPWARRGKLWILQSNPIGPGNDIINPDAFGPISAIPPGLSSRDRRTLAAVTLVLLALLIAARFVGWPLRYLLGVSVLTVTFSIVWRHSRPAVSSGQGDVVIQSSTLQRQDTWLYEVGRTQRVHSVPWSGFTRAVLPSEAVMADANLKLVDEGSTRFEYHTMPGRCVAFVKTDVTPAVKVAAQTASSPMQNLAKDLYVQPGMILSGSHQSTSDWPSVLLTDKR